MSSNHTLAGRVNILQDVIVTTQSVALIRVGTTNAGLALAPNGTGALMVNAPDGTTVGGNARGNNAVDLQMLRNFNTQVASGTTSTIGGGENNTASGQGSTVGGGGSNIVVSFGGTIAGGYSNSVAITAGSSTIAGGTSNTCNGWFSAITGGSSNITRNTAEYSTVSGFYGYGYLYGQVANAAGSFVVYGDSQTSTLTLRRSITGTATQELFLDGSSIRAGVYIGIGGGPTNARSWMARIDVVAIVETAGTGTLVLNDCFAGSYSVAIKNVGGTTALLPAGPAAGFVDADASMFDANVLISADDVNDSLKIEFKPPTTATATSVIRVVATVYLTEVGR